MTVETDEFGQPIRECYNCDRVGCTGCGDLRQRIAEALAKEAGSRAFRNTDRSWEHMRSAWLDHASAALSALKPELGELLHYRNAITWGTSCLSCSRILDNTRAREEELEQERDQLQDRAAELEEQVIAMGGHQLAADDQTATIARVQAVVDAAQGSRWIGMGWGPELLAALNAADGEPVQFAHVGGNAEDCPACEGSNLPYPFICPGPTNKEA